MPGKTKCSASRKADYTNRRTNNITVKNKARKLLKHLVKHPLDKQSAEHRIPSWPVVKHGV